MSRLNPPKCLVDYPLASEDYIDEKDLIEKTIEISTPGGEEVFSKNVPDFTENTALKKSVDQLLENVRDLFDTDGKELFLDEFATHVNSETVKVVSFIIINEKKRLVFVPILHDTDVDTMITKSQERIERYQEEIDTLTTSEVLERLVWIAVERWGIKKLRDFSQ